VGEKMEVPGRDEPSGNWEDPLVRRFVAGDEAAFNELFNAYKSRIFNYINKMTGDREVAEELTQETFISVYMNINNYKPLGLFKAWIYTIASNLTRNELKRRASKKDVSLNQPISDSETATLEDILSSEKLSPEYIAQNKELKTVIEKALRSLPDIYREVIILCVMEEMSYEDAARALCTNVKTVSSRLARAREMFIKSVKALTGK
jgi:RNA polymerase sigma-70 factor (ECF subfamily)